MMAGLYRTVMSHPSKKIREAFRDKMGLELHPGVYIELGDRGTKREADGSRRPLGKAGCSSILPFTPLLQTAIWNGGFLTSSRLRVAEGGVEGRECLSAFPLLPALFPSAKQSNFTFLFWALFFLRGHLKENGFFSFQLPCLNRKHSFYFTNELFP